MKMDTLIISPNNKDIPLFSYDRVYVMGNDTLILELYNTMINEISLSELEVIKNKYKYLNDHDLGSHWYDSIKCKESISKKVKKKESIILDSLTLEYFEKYLLLNSIEIDNCSDKINKNSIYVNGLLTNGGPSTTFFIKNIGEEKTKELFYKVLFGIE